MTFTSDARKSQMPILAFQSPVSGRVETVYGISIASDLDQDRLGGRLPASALTWFVRFVLHRENALAPGIAVFIVTAISHRNIKKITVRWRWKPRPIPR